MQINQALASPQAVSPQHQAVKQLEQAFLEEMLKYCGPQSLGGDFGGGIGEDQFSSFLTREYAAALSARIDMGFGKGIERQ